MDKRLIVMVGLFGCGDAAPQLSTDAATDDTGVTATDAAVAADAAVSPHDVPLQVWDTPQFLMYRDGSGPWVKPERVSSQVYRLHVTRTYDVLAAWVTSAGTQANLYHYAGNDSPFIYSALGGTPAKAAAPITLTGHMVQAGAVYIPGDSAMSESAPWDFSLEVAPALGTASLVAIGADRMVVRRAIDVSAPAALADIDLESEGVATTVAPLTLVNGPSSGETLASYLGWSGVGVTFPVSLATFRPPPASLVDPQEMLQLTVEARTKTTLRYLAGRYGADRNTYTLPPAVTGVSFGTSGDAPRASWGALPPMIDGVALDVRTSTQIMSVEASPSWVAATGATSLAFDAFPPGFDPAWKIDLEGAYTRQLVAYRNGFYPNNIDYQLSMVSNVVRGAAPLPPLRLSSVRD